MTTSDERRWTVVMKSQHSFWWWLGAVGEQVIAWTILAKFLDAIWCHWTAIT